MVLFILAQDVATCNKSPYLPQNVPDLSLAGTVTSQSTLSIPSQNDFDNPLGHALLGISAYIITGSLRVIVTFFQGDFRWNS